MSWGPSHQKPKLPQPGRVTMVLVGVVVLAWVYGHIPDIVGLVIVGGVTWRFVSWIDSRDPYAGKNKPVPAPGVPPAGVDGKPVGVWLGRDERGTACWSRAQRAVLVIGPPRSGKTSGVIIPTVSAHRGPVVVTSTKPDVLAATRNRREASGTVWQFDPTGQAPLVAGAERLRWSPLTCSLDWDGALLMARAMVQAATVGAGVTDGDHWARRSQALLAGLLHAAATGGESMSTLVGWVSGHELDLPTGLLSAHASTPLASQALEGIAAVEDRERSAIFSTTAGALDAYSSQAALEATEQPNFYAGRFVRSNDTIYINAPAEHQHLAAPLVCGLLAEIRRGTYQAHAAGVLDRPVLFALDEVANIAPIPELPQIASEGGSQGLLLLAVLQDLSQARGRWGTVTDGFLTLFGDKLILPGVADQRTLETISVTLGEYDRQVVSETRMRVPEKAWLQRAETISTQRTRVLSAGEIANIPAGKALHLDGVSWQLLTLTPAGR